MYQLSQRSLDELSGVHHILVEVVKRAITTTTIDFSVLDGVRTVEQQMELVNSGASQTMKSRHVDGCAVDLGAWVNGRIRWEPILYFEIAKAMRDAANELPEIMGLDYDIPIVWGACWKEINSLDDLDGAVAEVIKTKMDLGKTPFLDYPHFHLARRFTD